MKYFWQGILLGSFFFAPWQMTAIIGAVVILFFSTEYFTFGVFLLMDILTPPLSDFYIAMPLSLVCLLVIFISRYTRARVYLYS